MTDVKPIDQQTRAEQTRYLSREFVIGFVLQAVITVGAIAFAYGSLSERVEAQVEPAKVTELQQKVAVLEASQVDGERVAKLEQAMTNLEASLLRVQASLDRNFYGAQPQAAAAKRK